ncbi:hypothetical protein SARC_05553 [Sphaeroforma arctica JP610]|uniref:Uncharacterized protein n=1 Tax=Sphaeroforma arctica JP610 TaxID=667725 RepID=A0A0L0G005_9EUKA|nr:hypothetical protein SARC_05553 [Sphaeroforma arctica JP610]KNC82151.1 hypothetical protein SARC_05553 [Sphaeroforma arctica JP610]|eukprot:XP_014156053.1 hypothetical protein SARC_05553 [Sphaeroforma arctica JP610]
MPITDLYESVEILRTYYYILILISFAGLNQQTTTEDFHKHTDEGPTREALEAHVVGVYERALRTQKHGDNKLALELYNEALMSKQMVGVDRKVLRNKDPRSHTMLWLKYLINKNIAQLCTTDGLFSHSLQYFFEATKIEDTDPVVWLNFSDAAARADDIGLAISCAQSALRAEQHCWPAIDRLCVLLFTAGDYNGCNEIIAYALALDPLYARGQELAKAISSDETQRIKHYWLREARTAGDAATERSDEIASELQIGPGRPNLASRISGSARSGASHKMTNSRVNRKRKGRSTSTVGGGMKRRPNLADRLREKRLKRAKQYIDSAHTYNTSVPTQTIVLNEATWGGVCDALLSAHRAVVMPTAEQSPSMGGAGHELNGDTMCVHPFLSVKFELSPALSALPKPPPELQPPIRPSNLDLTVNKDSAAPEARSSEPIAAPSKDEQKAEREKERAKEAAPKPKRSSRLAAVKEAAQEAPIAQSTKLDNEIIWEDLLPTFIADSLKVLPGLADLTPGSTRSTTPHVHSSTTGMSSRNASSVGVSKGVTGSDTRQPSIALPWKDAESQNEPYMGFGGKLEEVKSRLQSEVRVTGDQTDAIPLTGATSMNSIEPGSTVAVRTDVGADEGSGTGTHKSRTEPRSTLAADTKVTTDAQKVNNSHLSETETTTAAAVKMEAPAEGQRTEDPHASQSDSKTTVDGNTGVTTEGHAAIDTKQSMPESSTTMTEESTGLADRPTVADVKQTTDESSITMTEELTGLADRPTVADVKQTTDESSTTMTEESTGLADVKQTMPESSTTMTEESTGLADRPTVADVKQITDELSPKLASHTEVTAEEHSVADTKHSSVEHSITVAEIAGVTTEGQAVIDTRQAVAEVSTTATVDTATPADGKRDTDEDLRMDTDAKSPLDPDTDASMDTLSSVVTAESQESPPPLVYVEVANPFMDSPAAFDANSSGDTSPVLASHSADEDRAVRYTDTTRNSNPTLEKVRSIDTDSGMDTKMTTDTNPSLKCDGYIVQTSTPVGAATINTDVEVGPAKDSNCSDNTHTATDTESHIKDGTPCAPTVDTNLPTATDTHATEASEPVVDVVENGSALTIDADAGDGMETTPGVNKPEQAHQALHTTADAPTESQADAELEVEGVGDEAAISAHATGPVGVDKINDGEIVGDDSFSSDTGLNESFDMGNDLGMESASTKAGVTEEKEATATEVQSDEKPKIAVQQDDSTKALQATNVDTTKEGASGSSMVSEEKEEGLQVAGSSTDAQKGLGEANSVRVADESGSVGSASQAPNDSTLVGEGIRLGTETESNAQTIADTKKRSEAGEASDTEDGTPASKKTRLDSEIGDSKVSEKETTYAHGVSVDTTYSDASVKPLGDAGAPEGEIGTSMDIDIRMDTNSDNTQPRRPLATSDDHGHTQTVAGGQGAAENPPIAASDALDTAVSPKVKTCGKTVAENTSAATVETPNSVEVVQEVETDPLDIGTIGAEGRADSATARGDNLSGSGSTESKGSSQMNTRGLYQRAHEREDEVMVGTADVPESHTSKMNTEKSSDVEKCEMKTKEERDPGIEIVDSYRKPKSPRAELCTHEFLAYQNNGDWLTTYLSTAFEARGNVDRIRCEVLARWGDTSASYELVGENGSSATLNHSTSCCTLGPPEGTPAALLQRQTPWSSLSNSARAALQARVIGLHDIVKQSEAAQTSDHGHYVAQKGA